MDAIRLLAQKKQKQNKSPKYESYIPVGIKTRRSFFEGIGDHAVTFDLSVVGRRRGVILGGGGGEVTLHPSLTLFLFIFCCVCSPYTGKESVTSFTLKAKEGKPYSSVFQQQQQTPNKLK